MLDRIITLNTARGLSRLLAIQSLALKQNIHCILIQEPPKNYNLIKKNPFADNWHFYFNSDKARAVICIAKNIHHKKIHQLPSPHDDLVILQINDTIIMNIYQEPNSTTIIDNFHSIISPYTNKPIIIAGDYNARHTHWDKKNNKQGLALVPIMEDLNLSLTNEPHQPTFDHFNGSGSSTIDLVLINDRASSLLISTSVADDELDVQSDHRPVIIQSAKAAKMKPFIKIVRNWKKTDWENLELELSNNLQEAVVQLKHNLPPTPSTLDTYYKNITAAIQKSIDSKVPTARICEKSKPWWTDELNTLKQAANQARRAITKFTKANGETNQHLQTQYLRKRRAFHEAIKKAKMKHARKIANGLNEITMWKMVRNMNEPSVPPTIPSLIDKDGNHITSTTDKTRLLAGKFFPTDTNRQYDATSWNLPNTYHSPISNPTLSPHEIQSALDSLDNDSAPGPDGIPVKLLTKCWTSLCPYITPLVQWSIATGHYPCDAKIGKTIALKKPNRHSGHNVNDYRPITMLNSIAKIIEKVITKRLTYWLEHNNRLPNEQFGFRPYRNCEQAIATLIDGVRLGWKSGRTTSTVFLDIKGAYDTVRHSKLLDELCDMKIPSQYIKWIASFLSNRCVQFSINEATPTTFPTNIGVPQGSALSPILYIIYNSRAFSIIRQWGCIPNGFADDLAISVSSFSTSNNAYLLSKAIKELQRQWCLPYGQQLAGEKSHIIHFKKPRTQKQMEDERPNIVIMNEEVIEPVTSVRYLGLTIDEKLNFHEHINKRVAKLNQVTGALTKLGYSDWGLEHDLRRRAINTIVLPIISYGSMVWSPYVGKTSISTLSTPYHRSLRWATGLLPRTNTTSLYAESGFLPLHHFLSYKNSTTIARWQALTHMPINFINPRTRERTIPKTIHQPYRPPDIHIFTINDLITKTNTFFEANVTPMAPPQVVSPWDSTLPGNLTIITNPSKDTAQQAWNNRVNNPEETIAYTDGSKSQDGCGSGWFITTEPPIENGVQLPSTTTIFQAEAIAMMNVIETMKEQCNHLVVATDSLSVLKAIQSKEMKIEPETITLRKIIREFCEDQTKRLVLQWIPGHYDIEGNEKADDIAKRASTGEFDHISHPTSPNVIKQLQYQQAFSQWSNEFQQCRSRNYISHSLPTRNNINNLYTGMSLRQCSIIAQFRSGHTELNSTNMRFHPPTDPKHRPRCPCCNFSVETREHMLFDCPEFDDLRNIFHQNMKQSIGMRTKSMEFLFSNPKLIGPTVDFLCQALTRRRAIH
jgi:ribonuclease HI